MKNNFSLSVLTDKMRSLYDPLNDSIVINKDINKDYLPGQLAHAGTYSLQIKEGQIYNFKNIREAYDNSYKVDKELGLNPVRPSDIWIREHYLFYKKPFNSITNNERVNNLSLTILTDNIEYKVGDNINIEFLVKNNSDKIISFPLLGPIYTADKIKFFEVLSKKQTESKPLVMVNAIFSEKKDDFIQLAKGEIYKTILTGAIKQGEMRYIATKSNEGRIGIYAGMYIDFKNSIIFLGGFGEYKLRGYLLASRDEAKLGSTKFNLPNVWSGKILSNETEIIIK